MAKQNGTKRTKQLQGWISKRKRKAAESKSRDWHEIITLGSVRAGSFVGESLPLSRGSRVGFDRTRHSNYHRHESPEIDWERP